MQKTWGGAPKRRSTTHLFQTFAVQSTHPNDAEVRPHQDVDPTRRPPSPHPERRRAQRSHRPADVTGAFVSGRSVMLTPVPKSLGPRRGSCASDCDWTKGWGTQCELRAQRAPQVKPRGAAGA